MARYGMDFIPFGTALLVMQKFYWLETREDEGSVDTLTSNGKEITETYG
jgi:hypothetical protein